MRVKGIFVLLSLALMLLIPHLAMAANPIHYFDCKDCHRPGFAIDQIDSNICLSCHGATGALIPDTPRGPISANPDFATGDASDHYGNGAAIVGDQTSHNWAAPSTNPAAGASEPNRATYPGFYSRYGTTVGTVACSRCHDPHAQYGTGNDKLLPLNATRTAPMDVNEMCVACHSDFAGAMSDPANHGMLTHPLVASYDDTQPNYKSVVANYDSNNPPADPYVNGVQLVDGGVSCLSCHNLHFTDSDASTPDGPGAALNAGDGLMLRGNGTQVLGANGYPTGGSICIECHEYDGTGAINAFHGANGGTKDVGCLACHGGHNYNNNNPTWYMLNDPTGSYSTPGVPPANLTTAWVGTEGVVDGFCETCHGDVTQWTSAGSGADGAPVDRDHDFAGDSALGCDSCHNSHGEGSFSEAAGCTDCHGWPPNTATAGGPSGYADATLAFAGFPATTYNYQTNNGGATYLDESATAHAQHALGNANEYKFSCGQCHQGNTHNDANGGANDNPTFQDVFIDTTGLLATTGVLTPVYTPGTNTCDAVYCHSDGVNADRVIAGPNPVDMTTFSWASGANATCTSCHNTGTSGTAAVHATHLALPALDGAAVTCGTCHNDTWAAANTLKAAVGGEVVSAHVDGDIDVTFNTTLVPTAPMNQVSGTCAVYCHSNGTAPVQIPDWDDVATGDCGDCHAVASGNGLSPAHDTHLDQGLACNACHTHDGSAFGGDHINGTKDVTADVCNACHGTTTAGTGVDAYPVFTDPTSVTCNTCHQGVLAVIGGTAPDASGTATNLHSDTCTTCHTATADPDHIGGAATQRLIAASSTAACNSCHGVGGSVGTMNNIITHQAKNCATCHDPHYAGSNLSMVRPASVDYTGTVVFTATTGANSYDENDAANGDDICATCHTAANQTSQHNNSTNAGIAHNEGTDCFTCHLTHTNSPSAFAVGGGDSCDGCHGYPPATAAHNLHSPDSDTLDTAGKVYRDGTNGFADVTSCAFCHTTAESYTYNPAIDQGNALNHGNAAGRVTILGTSVGFASATSTCASACHDGTSGVAAAWTDTSLACDACHYQSATPTQAGNTSDVNTISAGHNAHFNSSAVCTDCHAAAADTAHITDRSGADEAIKIQGMAMALQDEAAVIAGNGFDAVANTCSTASCHNDARPGNDVVTSAWGTDDPNCTQCHAAAPSTGSHTKHIPAATDCSDCHTSALQDTSYNSAQHFDTNIDVAIGSYPTDKAINSAFSTCDAPSCHDDGRAPTITPTWGTSVTTCLACHEAVPSTGSHSSHVADAAVDCNDCHTGAVQETTAPTAGHQDGNIDITGGSGYPTNRALTSAFTNCTTASCHDDGRNSGVTSNWGTTLNNCSECHATVPATGGHGAHVGVSFAGAAIACADCHAGAVQGTTAPTTNHRDGDTNATAYPVTTNGGAFQTCTTATCHQTGQAVNDYTITPAWDADTANCSQCHAASPTTGSHTKHLTVTLGTCWSCHTDAIVDTSYANANHGDLNIDVALGGYTADKPIGDPKESCSINCHSDGMAATGTSPVWGTAGGACDVCHLSDMTTGSHTAHLADGAACGDCHDGAVKDINAGTAHTDGNVDVTATYATADAAYGAATWTTCSAASCHDDGRAPNVTADWGTTVNNCAECHATQPATGSHAAHLSATALGAAIACGDCHSGVTEGTTANATDHRDGNIDTAGALGYTTANKGLGTAFESCATVNCHSNGQAATGSTPVWGNAGDCTTCHASNMTSGSHTIHLADGAACGDCHDGAVKDNNAGTAHIDGNVDVASTGYATANAAYGAGSYTTCNAASCHDNGTGTLVTTPDWGTTANCTECHTTIPATGAHTTHLTQTLSTAFTLNCTDCHDGAVWGTSATTIGHRDGNVDVTGGHGYPADAVKGAPYDTCSTTYCHGDNMPKGTTSGTTNNPNWGDSSTGCTFCHDVTAAPVAIAAHDGKTFTDCITCHDNTNAAGTGFVDTSLHINGTLEGGGDSCADCHFNVGTDVRASGAHAAHNTIAYTGALSTSDYGNAANGWYNVTYTNGVPSFACGYCHPSTVAGHMTKQVSLDPTQDANAGGTVKALNDAGAGYAGGVCSATYCHSDGVNVAAGTSPNWISGNISGNCNDCHGNSPTTAAHGAHEVGIHYAELYDKTNGGLLATTGTVGSGAAHGDTDISSTISCFTCHKDTVTDSANATNSTCGSCHNDLNSFIDGDENARILTTSTTHLNGVKDVAFADLSTFKSPAQLRDNLADADDGTNLLSAIWNRITGYKAAGSYDTAQAALSTPSFTQGADTCSTTVCHNGNTATWSDSGVDCMYCHTSLPK